MFTNSVLAVTGALLSVVAAVPMAEPHHHHLHHKRAFVWVTKTEEEIVTVPITKTVWIEPGQTPSIEFPPGYSPPESSTPDAVPTSSSAPAPAYTPATSSSYTPPAVYVPPTTSSTPVYVPPTTSSTPVYVAPTTSSSSSSVYVAPTTSAAPAYSAPASYSGSSSGVSYGMGKSGTSYSGDLTYYAIGLGACGWTNGSDANVVAVSHTIFYSYPDGGNPNNNPLCGKWVTITGADGQPYQAQIVDSCPGCSEADLDLSESYFNTVTNHADGRAHNMKWSFN